MTVELVHVSAQDRIIAAPLRSHSAMVVHVRRWMVLSLHSIVVTTEVTGRDPRIGGTASPAKVRYCLKRAVFAVRWMASRCRGSVRIRNITSIVTGIPSSSVRLLLFHVVAVRLLLLVLLWLVVVSWLRIEIGRQVGMRQEMMLLMLMVLLVLLMLLLLLMMVVKVVVLLLLLLVVLMVGHRVQILIISFSVTECHADTKRRVNHLLVLLLVRMVLLHRGGRTGARNHFPHSGLHRVAQRAIPSF